MSVGLNAIDDDHRQLILIINTFETRAGTGATEKDLSDLLMNLYRYAHDHFAREEAIQGRIGFPECGSHAAEHRELLRLIRGKARAWFVDRDRPIDAQSIDEMAGFLRHWLVDHILQHDLRMVPYIREAKTRAKAGKAKTSA